MVMTATIRKVFAESPGEFDPAQIPRPGPDGPHRDVQEEEPRGPRLGGKIRRRVLDAGGRVQSLTGREPAGALRRWRTRSMILGISCFESDSANPFIPRGTLPGSV
ncbi:MAG: hypothetical protein MZV63_14330 [Marinilabiliales bacterium]|nr:hypothetical protein [Marinilabiliales bacterium]